MNRSRPTTASSGRAVWVLTVTVLAVVSAATLLGPLGDVRWGSPLLLFSLVTVAAVACILGATVVLAIADHRQLAEVGLLGSALLAASVMPLVHGLVTPGVLYDANGAFRLATFLTLPIAVAVAAPLLRPHSGFGRWAARHWRDWSLLSVAAAIVAAALVVAFPDAIAAPEPSSPLTIAGTVVLITAIAAISLRQLRFYELGSQPANLVASLSLVMLAGTALLPLTDNPYSPGFWMLHLTGSLGVLGACVGLAISKRMSRHALDLLEPVLARDPLVAFELGLSPVVHRFVSELEQKDAPSRDHVVRTAEMAVRVGERLHLSARELRDLGLAALLHDIGKVNIPDEVLTKPSRLTADEYELIKVHTVDGAEMLLTDETLSSVAPLVRSHHERIDGRGYPDGLAGAEIPLSSRIIAVCDALDAMTHAREYRPAMSARIAFAVLDEHAGSQWDERVIAQVKVVLPSMAIVSGLDNVGRGEILSRVLGASIEAPADDVWINIPDDVGALLVTVDAEI